MAIDRASGVAARALAAGFPAHKELEKCFNHQPPFKPNTRPRLATGCLIF